MSKKKILVVDDDRVFRAIICQFFESSGNKEYQVAEAENGTKALDLVKETPYDAIIMDLILPDISGIEVTKKIREFNKSIAIIIVTGAPSLETSIEAEKLGVYDYVEKPIEPENLVEMIKEALG